MSDGLRALMAYAAKIDEPLPFAVSMYHGSMFTSGTIAPWWYMYDVTIAGRRAELEHAYRRTKNEDERRRGIEHWLEQVANVMRVGREHEGDDHDEVTLIDATVYPAIGTQGTTSAGHQLPVVRAPLASITSWWIIDGTDTKGSGGGGSTWGFLVDFNT